MLVFISKVVRNVLFLKVSNDEILHNKSKFLNIVHIYKVLDIFINKIKNTFNNIN